MKKFAFIAVSLLALSGCETLQNAGASGGGWSSGGSGKLRIVTAPEGAYCALDRDNKTFDRTDATPVTVNVDRAGKDIVVRCIKSGYKEGKAVAKLNDSIVTIKLVKK